MLEQLLDLVRKNAGVAVADNPAIPNDKNEAAVQSAGGSILATLKNALSEGKLNDVLSYFAGGGAGTNPIVEEAKGNYARDLQNNFGVDEAEAQSVSNTVIPETMNQLAGQTADPANSNFNIQDIFNHLSGGKSAGIDAQALLMKFAGAKLDKDGDGDIDLQDLTAMFKDGGSGGIMDQVRGLFK